MPITATPMEDRNGTPISENDVVCFMTDTGKDRWGIVQGRGARNGKTAILLDGDPFAVCLPLVQVIKNTGRRPGKDGRPRKPRASTAEGTLTYLAKPLLAKQTLTFSPFRDGTSLAFVYAQLREGGKVSDIATRVAEDFPHPSSLSPGRVRKRSLSRVMATIRKCRRLGYRVTQEGRGPDAYVQVSQV